MYHLPIINIASEYHNIHQIKPRDTEKKMANSMQLTFLNDLEPRKTACRIQVKIINTWRHFMKDVGESMELILCDANVN